jgi:UDP-glucose 4-epimerase
MASILVTGGAGFIGSYLAQAFLAHDHDVTVVDNLDDYYPQTIKRRNLDRVRAMGEVMFVQEDAGDYAAMRQLVDDQEITVIFHESARPGIRQSLADPLATHRQNVAVTLHLLKVAVDCDLDLFVNASSSSVYGEPIALPLEETQPTQPISPYGISKQAAELYTRCFYDVYALPTVSLRYFTVYGPRMRPDLAIFTFTRDLMAGRQPVVFGDGEQRRDFTYIDDVITANLAVLNRPPVGETLNIGHGDHVSINTLLTMLGKLTGSTIPPRYKHKLQGDVSHTWASVEKAQRLLGWQSRVPLAEGLERFVDWYRSEQEVYEQLLVGW